MTLSAPDLCATSLFHILHTYMDVIGRAFAPLWYEILPGIFKNAFKKNYILKEITHFKMLIRCLYAIIKTQCFLDGFRCTPRSQVCGLSVRFSGRCVLFLPRLCLFDQNAIQILWKMYLI